MSPGRNENYGPVIFVPYIRAFGGVERLILSLSRFLEGCGQPHLLLCFEDTVGMENRADWPLMVRALKPARNPLSESWALHRALKDCRENSGLSPLLFDLKSAFYAGISGDAGHVLHFTDPPSFLGSDITKHAYSFRQEDAVNRALSSPLLRVRAEAAHRLTARGVRASKRVIVMTERISKEIRDLYSVTPMIHRPGVGRARFASASKVRARPCLRILSVSRMEAGKNLAWIVRAIRSALLSDRLGNGGMSWTLEFVGVGAYERELREQVAGAGLADHTLFHGHVTDGQLAALHGQAALIVVAAAQGYGLPALEALARGVPVVLNRASGVSEVLAGTRWVEPSDNNEEAFAGALCRMLDRIRSGELSAAPPPGLPTAEEWAEAVCQTCGWI